MRIGEVVGRVSLVRAHPSLEGQRWVLAVPQSLAALGGKGKSTAEEVVVIDELGTTPGDRIAFSEGAEAVFAFHPAKKPVDAYAACLIDEIAMDQSEVASLLSK